MIPPAGTSSTAATGAAQQPGRSGWAITRSDQPHIERGPSAPRIGEAPHASEQIAITVLKREGLAPGSDAVLQQGLREGGGLDEGAPPHWWIARALDTELSAQGLPLKAASEDGTRQFSIGIDKPDHAGVPRKGRLAVDATLDANHQWHLTDGGFRDRETKVLTQVSLERVRDEGLATASLEWPLEHADSDDGSQRCRVAQALYGALQADGLALQPAVRAGAPLQLHADQTEGGTARLVCSARIEANSKFELAGAALIAHDTGRVLARSCIAGQLHTAMVAPQSLRVLHDAAGQASLTNEQVAQLLAKLEEALAAGQLARAPQAAPDAAPVFEGRLAAADGEPWNARVSVATDSSGRLHLAVVRFERPSDGDSASVDMAKRLFASAVAPASLGLLQQHAADAASEHRPIAQALLDGIADDQFRKRSTGYEATVTLADGRQGKLFVRTEADDNATLQLLDAVFRDRATGQSSELRLQRPEEAPGAVH